MKEIREIADLRSGRYYLEYDDVGHQKMITIVRCCDIRNKLFYKMWAEGEALYAIGISRVANIKDWEAVNMEICITEMNGGDFNIEPRNYHTFELTEDEIYNIVALRI
jgi:hypothetical protein